MKILCLAALANDIGKKVSKECLVIHLVTPKKDLAATLNDSIHETHCFRRKKCAKPVFRSLLKPPKF
eukprot:06679.XXX_271493_271690_1 [CDS] Oithona nana genome sequencing.